MGEGNPEMGWRPLPKGHTVTNGGNFTAGCPMTLGVLAVVQDGEGRVLLVKTSYRGLRWQLPGGYVEQGESPLEALSREAQEELGTDIHDPQLVCVYCKTYESNMNLIFRGALGSGHPVADGKEVLECRYYRIDDLPAEVSPRVRAIILAAVQGPVPFLKVFKNPLEST